MSRCKICHRARCRWFPISPGMIKRHSTERLIAIRDHNLDYIDMQGRQGRISVAGEERLYEELGPITAEIEKRGEK